MHPSIKNSINKTRVLQEVRKSHGISRVEIAAKLGLDKSTISKITSDLLQEGFLVDKKSQEGVNHAGRRRIGLQLNISYGVVIGIEIQTKYYNALVMNLRGEILSTSSQELPGKDLDFTEALTIILDNTIENVEKSYPKILGIGIGIPGHVDPVKGVIIRSNPLNITSSIDVYSFVKERYDYPIFLDNDANCCCWGEITFKEGKVDNNFLVALGEIRQTNIEKPEATSITVGLGIVIDGKVLIGDNFSAGEFISMKWQGNHNTQFSISDKEALLIPENREQSLKVVDELMQHIALFTNTFNFTKILFAGTFTNYKDDIDYMLNRHIDNNWSYNTKPDVDIEFTSFDNYDVSYGAGGMIVEKLFTTPDISGAESLFELKGIDLFNYIK